MFLVLMFCNISFADSLRVVDGDTIVLNGERIRFSGIDTPELKQTCMKDEEFAKENKLGMWSMKFEYPWVFRKL